MPNKLLEQIQDSFNGQFSNDHFPAATDDLRLNICIY